MLTLPTATVDLDALCLSRDGVEHSLTQQEGELLAFLAARPNQTVPRDQIQVEVFGYSPHVVTRAVDAAVSRLRAKLEPDPRSPASLLSVRGKGYRLVVQEPPTEPPAPKPVAGLLGRDAELRALVHAVASGARAQIIGPGGAGKTALAMALLETCGGRFVELASSRTPDELHSAIAVAFGVSLDHADDPADPLRLALEAAGSVVVFDNLEQLRPEAGAALSRLIDGLPTAIVVTSRGPFLDCAPTIPLGTLDVDASVSLLQRAAARSGATAPNDEVLHRVAASMDRLPLALELVGARLPFLGPMDGAEAALDVGDGRSGRHATLAAAIGWSWELLPPPSQEALSRWAVFEGAFTLDEAQDMLANRSDSAAQRASELHDAGLLTGAQGTLRLWESVRAFALRQLGPAALAAARAAHAAALLSRCPVGVLADDRAPAEVRAWIGARRADLVEATHHTPDPRTAARLALTLLTDSARLGSTLRRDLADLAQARADATGDPSLRLEATLAAVKLGVWGGSAAQALERLAAAPKVDGRWELTVAASILTGINLRRIGRMDDAQHTLARARADAEHHGLMALAARADQELGALYRRMGRLDEAQEHLMRSLAVHRTVGDRRLQAGCWISLASIHRIRGESGVAIRYAERGAHLARAIDDPLLLANSLNNLGTSRLQAGDTSGVDDLTESIALSRRHGDRLGLSVAVGCRGACHDLDGRHLDAELDFREAFACATAAGNALPAAFWSYRLADLAHRSGRLEEAERGYDAAIAMLDAQQAAPQRLHARVMAATLAAERAHAETARRLLDEADALAQGEEDDRILLAVGREAVARWLGASAEPDPFAALGVERSALRRPLMHVAREIHARAPRGSADGA